MSTPPHAIWTHPHTIWTDQKGTTHTITELSDAHLVNILKLLYKPETVAKVRKRFLGHAESEDSQAEMESGSMQPSSATWRNLPTTRCCVPDGPSHLTSSSSFGVEDWH